MMRSAFAYDESTAASIAGTFIKKVHHRLEMIETAGRTAKEEMNIKGVRVEKGSLRDSPLYHIFAFFTRLFRNLAPYGLFYEHYLDS